MKVAEDTVSDGQKIVSLIVHPGWYQAAERRRTVQGDLRFCRPARVAGLFTQPAPCLVSMKISIKQPLPAVISRTCVSTPSRLRTFSADRGCYRQATFSYMFMVLTQFDELSGAPYYSRPEVLDFTAHLVRG